MRFLAILQLLMLFLVRPAWAQSTALEPDCDVSAAIDFPQLETTPAISIWNQEDLTDAVSWLPGCTGWTDLADSDLVVAVAGSLYFEGEISEILSRVGNISGQRNVRYWSVTDLAWRPFLFDASALSSSDPRSRRPDFSASEIISEDTLYYWVNDSRFGEIVYALNILHRNQDGAAITIENLTPVRFFVFELASPGTFQFAFFLERLSSNRWGVYLLNRLATDARVTALGGERSLINRTVAIYRFLADIPTDLEPPAEP